MLSQMKNIKKFNLLQAALVFFTLILICGFIFMVKAAHSADQTGKSDDVNKPATTEIIKTETITEWYEAVGTIRPRTESSIEAQVTAKIVDVKVRPGNKVGKGQLLVVLDNRQFAARLDQAKQARKSAVAGQNQAKQMVAAATAAFDQAESNFKRIKTYYQSKAATAQDLEKAESAYLQAKAEVERAKEALIGAEASIRQADEVVKEAEIALEYTRIKAQEDGEVLKRLVEPGDLALPGKPLIILQTAGALRLEAYVREGLIDKLKSDAKLRVSAGTLNEPVEATIDEIVPYADPQTRTFLVKASIPRIEGIYPGMFGKLLIPAAELEVVTVPEAAVRKIGQLELINVKEDNGWKMRYIKTGKKIGARVEVLSGLSENEIVGY